MTLHLRSEDEKTSVTLNGGKNILGGQTKVCKVSEWKPSEHSECKGEDC